MEERRKENLAPRHPTLLRRNLSVGKFYKVIGPGKEGNSPFFIVDISHAMSVSIVKIIQGEEVKMFFPDDHVYFIEITE